MVDMAVLTKMLHINPFLVVAVILLLPYGQRAVSSQGSLEQQGEADLLALHRSDRTAHFKHDVATLLEHIGPQLLDIRHGKINSMNRYEVRRRFTDYFQSAQFSAWDDLESPIVKVSPDGQFGWMAVRVHIAYTEIGKNVSQSSVMAWTSTYERRTGNWIMTTVTTTSDQPGER